MNFVNLMTTGLIIYFMRVKDVSRCQVPYFRDLSDIYSFVFGYKSDGLFVEVRSVGGDLTFTWPSHSHHIPHESHACRWAHTTASPSPTRAALRTSAGGAII